jgi:hypothetical protein
LADVVRCWLLILFGCLGRSGSGNGVGVKTRQSGRARATLFLFLYNFYIVRFKSSFKPCLEDPSTHSKRIPKDQTQDKYYCHHRSELSDRSA